LLSNCFSTFGKWYIVRTCMHMSYSVVPNWFNFHVPYFSVLQAIPGLGGGLE